MEGKRGGQKQQTVKNEGKRDAEEVFWQRKVEMERVKERAAARSPLMLCVMRCNEQS